jgi:predicted aldo/keto reductase-like oxidoreductase
MKTMAGAYWDKEQKRPINTKAALKWVLKNENITTTVPDCSNTDQLIQDIEVMSDLNLSDEELQDLKPPSEGLTSGIYCQQCGSCLDQCPNRVDIPVYMRSYMYAFGHHNFPHAKYTLESAGSRKDPCSRCSKCDVKCLMGFDIRKKIREISGILDIPQDFLHV